MFVYMYIEEGVILQHVDVHVIGSHQLYHLGVKVNERVTKKN